MGRFTTLTTEQLIPELFRPQIQGKSGRKFPNSGIFLNSVDLFVELRSLLKWRPIDAASALSNWQQASKLAHVSGNQVILCTALANQLLKNEKLLKFSALNMQLPDFEELLLRTAPMRNFVCDGPI